MSTRTEERLSAALAARAEQVHPEDLRPLVSPAAPRRPWGAYALAAAALAAVVASPFVVEDLTSGPGPAPAPATQLPSPSVSPTPTTTTQPGHVVRQRGTADVDGDGRPDQVELRYRAGRAVRIISARVTVTLATGRVTSAAGGVSDYPHLAAPVDVDGDGRQAVMTTAETGDATIPLVFAYRQGRLQRLAYAYRTPPLDSGVDAEGRWYRWWTTGKVGLFSANTPEPVDPSAKTVRMKVYRWKIVHDFGNGSMLDADVVPGGTQCYTPSQDETPHAC